MINVNNNNVIIIFHVCMNLSKDEYKVITVITYIYIGTRLDFEHY